MSQEQLDHRSLLRSLSNEQRKILTGKSNWPGLANLALHWGLILLLGGLIALRIPYWPMLLVPQGILIIFLFTLLHETVHRTAFKTLRVNKAVAWVCGFLIILPPGWFRCFHFEHHRHTQDPERDPELARPKPDSLWRYAVHLSGLPVWCSHLRTLVRNALGRCDDVFVPKERLGKLRREARTMLVLYVSLLAASVAAGSAVLLYVWLLPLLIGQPFLRLYLLAEHGRCPEVANMLANSRTLCTNRVVRTLAWNMPYHAEHHSYPAVPYHRLPDFHALTRGHLQVTEPGYLSFHGKYVVSCIRSRREADQSGSNTDQTQRPPSISSSTPVIMEASSEAR